MVGTRFGRVIQPSCGKGVSSLMPLSVSGAQCVVIEMSAKERKGGVRGG